MKNTILSGIAILAITASPNVLVADKGLENYIAAIQKQKTGEFVKLEELNASGRNKSRSGRCNWKNHRSCH